MPQSRYHKKTINGRSLHPETQMMSFGYDPFLSEGAVKPSRASLPPVRAKMTPNTGRRTLQIQDLLPLMSQSPPQRCAVDSSAAASGPACGPGKP